MIDETVPAIKIIKAMIEKIDRAVKIYRVNYDFDKMEYTFLLSKDSKTCGVSLPRAFLDDLNDYTGSRESKYWIALEGALKRRLSIPMQIAGLIPFSSDIFFEDNQDWEQDNGHNIEVYFFENDYEIFYAAKQWPTLERRAAQERAFKENSEYILPIRIDGTEIPGILDTVGYQDLRGKSIEAIYEVLKKKLLPVEEVGMYR